MSIGIRSASGNPRWTTLVRLASILLLSQLAFLCRGEERHGTPNHVVKLQRGERNEVLVLRGEPPRTHFDASGVTVYGGHSTLFSALPTFCLLSSPERDPEKLVGYETTEALYSRRLPMDARLPVQVRDMESPSLSGLSVIGVQRRELPWRIVKNIWDGDAVVLRHCTGHAVVSDVHWENVEDGFGPHQDLSRWSLKNAYMRFIRDDAIENDDLIPGEIINCLIDGCWVFLSHRPDEERESDVVTHIRDCVVHVETQPHDGVENREWRDRNIVVGDDGIGRAPGMLFKWFEGGGSVVVENCVFRVDAMSFSGASDMSFPPGRYDSVTLVWLGAGPYPQPLPPGVSLTRDIEVWNDARNRWISRLDPSHPAAKFLNP